MSKSHWSTRLRQEPRWLHRQLSFSRAIVGATFACTALSCASSDEPTIFAGQHPGAAVPSGTGGAKTVAVASSGGATAQSPTSAPSAAPTSTASPPAASSSGGAPSVRDTAGTGGATGAAGCDATGSCGAGGSANGEGDAGGPPPAMYSVFDDAPPFVAHTGQRTHNAGKDCMRCHATATDGGEAPRFSFGGTVYDPMGNPVVGAEVRLVDANGKATSVYTSSSGTFYSQGAGFAAPAHVGVRDATIASDMLPELKASDGACSACHCTGAACMDIPVHLP
jgi:hypothetical protein